MSKKLVAKISLPNKKQNNKRRSRRPKRTGPSSRGRDLVTEGKQAMSSAARITERWMPIFPSTITKTLRYSTSVALGAAVGAPSTWVFRLNDLFDPDATGTGHQPMGFDQLMTWYNHFVVISARIKVTFRNNAASGVTVAIRVDGSATPLTTIDRIIEDGGLTMDTLEFKGVSGSIRTLDVAANVCRLQAVSRSALTSDPNLRGDAATSPVELSYFHLVCWDSTGSSTTNVVADVILEQVAQFMEPRDMVES